MSTIESCLFALCVIVFIGLIFAIVAYLIHITNILEFKKPDEVVKVDKKREPPFLRSYSVCASVEIEKVYDEVKHEFTGEYKERAFFRSYAVPTPLKRRSCLVEAVMTYPVGQCPWKPGDLLEFNGTYMRSVANPQDIIAYTYNDPNDIAQHSVLSDEWYKKNVDDYSEKRSITQY